MVKSLHKNELSVKALDFLKNQLINQCQLAPEQWNQILDEAKETDMAILQILQNKVGLSKEEVTSAFFMFYELPVEFHTEKIGYVFPYNFYEESLDEERKKQLELIEKFCIKRLKTAFNSNVDGAALILSKGNFQIKLKKNSKWHDWFELNDLPEDAFETFASFFKNNIELKDNSSPKNEFDAILSLIGFPFAGIFVKSVSADKQLAFQKFLLPFSKENQDSLSAIFKPEEKNILATGVPEKISWYELKKETLAALKRVLLASTNYETNEIESIFDQCFCDKNDYLTPFSSGSVNKRNELLSQLAEELGVGFIKEIILDNDLVQKLIPIHILRKHGCVPVKFENNEISLAMINPLASVVKEDIELMTNFTVIPSLGDPKVIASLLGSVSNINVDNSSLCSGAPEDFGLPKNFQEIIAKLFEKILFIASQLGAKELVIEGTKEGAAVIAKKCSNGKDCSLPSLPFDVSSWLEVHIGLISNYGNNMIKSNLNGCWSVKVFNEKNIKNDEESYFVQMAFLGH